MTRLYSRCLPAPLALLLLAGAALQAADKNSAAQYLQDVQTGSLQVGAISRLSFGPHGLLLAADRRDAAIVAIDTGDLGPLNKLQKPVENLPAQLAAAIGADSVTIDDLTVNPLSGTVYVAVTRKPDNKSVIATVAGDGEIGLLELANAKYVRVTLPEGEKSKVSNISSVAFANDRILAAGQCNEEFSSKIFSLPLPLKHGGSGSIYSAETYHVSHRKWETRAPIQSFIPFEDDGKSYVVGSFACTPIAKFPIDELQSGAKVKGTSVVELGSGNRPRDMFTYERDGKQWVVTNTERFHPNLFGPSKYWGVRLDVSYIENDEQINEEAVRRKVSEKEGPEGMQVVDALFGAVEVAKLSNDEIVVLRDHEGRLDLELAPLP